MIGFALWRHGPTLVDTSPKKRVVRVNPRSRVRSHGAMLQPANPFQHLNPCMSVALRLGRVGIFDDPKRAVDFGIEQSRPTQAELNSSMEPLRRTEFLCDVVRIQRSEPHFLLPRRWP